MNAPTAQRAARYSGAATPPAVFRRRLAVRLGLVAVWFGLLVLLFLGGRGHVLIIDNQTFEGTAPLPQGFAVSIDGGKPVEFSFGLDRDMAKVQGQNHRVTITGLTGGASVTRDIVINLNDDMALVSIPRLVAGIEPAVVTFVPKDVAVPKPAEPAPAEEIPTVMPGAPGLNLGPEGLAAPVAP